METTNMDAAYIAGLFDGEGSVNFNWSRKKSTNRILAYPRLRIGMCDQDTIEWVKHATRIGFIYKRVRKGHGKIKPWQNFFIWVAANKQAAEFAKLILPYAKTKKPHLEILLDYAALIHKQTLQRQRVSPIGFRPISSGEWQERAKLIRKLYKLNDHRTIVAYKYIEEIESY